jgi:hypothetical protein
MLTTTTVCMKVCQRSTSTMTFELETFGIASLLHVQCDCAGHSSTAGAYMKGSGMENLKAVEPGMPYKNSGVSATAFHMKGKLLLELQLSGSGQTEGKIITGMLNLANNPIALRITERQQVLGKAILQIGREKDLSPIGLVRKKATTVSNNARLDKCAADPLYDSLSGWSVMNGNQSGFTICLCSKHST